MKIIKRTLLFFALFIAVDAFANVYTIESVPNMQVLDSTQLMFNPDNLIASSDADEINDILLSIRRATTAEVVVLVIDDFEGDDIDLFATDLFNYWGIGKKNNNGVLFLVAMSRHKLTIRTGYGVEGVLPDVICGRIIRDVVVPYFKEDDYAGGILEGTRQIQHFLCDPLAAEELIAENENNQKDGDSWILYLLLAVIGGLGGSVAFKTIQEKRKRKKPRICPKCNTQMVRMSETEDNKYLDERQDKEEQLGSVDYDVWVCPNCQEKLILPYVGKKSKRYEKCPLCQAKALATEQVVIISRATHFSCGKEEHHLVCKHCGHKTVKVVTTPVLPAPVSGGSGGSGSIGGGFGGGRTGGGGASGGW